MSSQRDGDFIDDIMNRYAALENDLDRKLAIIEKNEKQFQLEDAKIKEDTEFKLNTPEGAKQRNSDLIKALEMSKARLRSRATFSPLEPILKKAINNYKMEMSLLPVTKKSYGPTFV